MSGRGPRKRLVTGSIVDPAGTLNAFETDKLITDIPTQYIQLDPAVRAFTLNSVRYLMTPTNAVTYELILLKGASLDDVESLSNIVWRSGAAMASGTPYKRCNNEDELPIDVLLDDPGKLYYLQLWTGATGNTLGFVEVEGIELLNRR